MASEIFANPFDKREQSNHKTIQELNANMIALEFYVFTTVYNLSFRVREITKQTDLL